MADLIDREAKIEVLVSLEYAICAGMFKRVGPEGPGESNEEFCEALRWAVSVVKDAESVRHGRWIGVQYDGYADGFPFWGEWECSECGCGLSGDADILTAYCPNCGAKMEGGS